MIHVKTALTRALNDRLRQKGLGGRIFITSTLAALGRPFLAKAVEVMRSFDAFNPDNDPYDEHDFGAFEVESEKLFFKIDYYDGSSMTAGAADPSAPELCERVLTLMLASDY